MFDKLLKKANNRWTRLIILLVTSVNTGAMLFDVELIPYSDEQIATGVSWVAMIVVELWNHWSNNSYTPEAKHADAYLRSRKDQKKKNKKRKGDK